MGISWRAFIAAVSVACFMAATGVGAVLAADAGHATALKRVVGTKEANVLRGTPRADLIDGRAGNDTLYGFGGNDRLIGGAGADRILCGRGRDTAIADSRDTIAKDCEEVRGVVTPRPPPPVPEALVGMWTRNITDGAVIGDDHRGIWKISFDGPGSSSCMSLNTSRRPRGGSAGSLPRCHRPPTGSWCSQLELAATGGVRIAGRSLKES